MRWKDDAGELVYKQSNAATNKQNGTLNYRIPRKLTQPRVEKKRRRSPLLMSQCSSSSFFCCRSVPFRVAKTAVDGVSAAGMGGECEHADKRQDLAYKQLGAAIVCAQTVYKTAQRG